MLNLKDIKRPTTTTRVYPPPPTRSNNSFRGRYPYRRPNNNNGGRFNPTINEHQRKDYIERLQGQKRVLENLILIAENNEPPQHREHFNHPKRNFRNYKSRLPDLRGPVNRNIKETRINRKEEAIERKNRYSPSPRRLSPSPKRRVIPKSRSPSPKRRRSPSPRSPTPRRRSTITPSRSPTPRRRSLSSRSPTPRRRSPSSISPSPQRRLTITPSKSPKRKRSTSISPSPNSRSPSPKRQKSNTNSRSPSISYYKRSKSTEYSIEYDADGNEFKNIEEGEVVMKPMVVEDCKYRIDSNWILDCDCMDEEGPVTPEECFYCKHGSVFTGTPTIKGLVY